VKLKIERLARLNLSNDAHCARIGTKYTLAENALFGYESHIIGMLRNFKLKVVFFPEKSIKLGGNDFSQYLLRL
jgi:hypothetical protein